MSRATPEQYVAWAKRANIAAKTLANLREELDTIDNLEWGILRDVRNATTVTSHIAARLALRAAQGVVSA